jgi:hypothetical protein
MAMSDPEKNHQNSRMQIVPMLGRHFFFFLMVGTNRSSLHKTAQLNLRDGGKVGKKQQEGANRQYFPYNQLAFVVSSTVDTETSQVSAGSPAIRCIMFVC